MILIYSSVNEFSTVSLGCEKGDNLLNIINKLDNKSMTKEYMKIFNELWEDKEKLQDVTEEILENITVAYQENSPELIYFFTLYNIFSEFLEDISEDYIPNEATGFKESKIWNLLFNYQKDAVLGIINKLEKYNGCILADSVGLGKTFTALAVIKYYENRNKMVLVLCPKKLSDNWNTYKENYRNNPIKEDRLRYDVLYHTDLSRTKGESNGKNLELLNWENYDLIVIDESHNFRNGGKLVKTEDDKQNRYEKLMNQVIRKGVQTKVLMLSATPVNNGLNDLKNQLALAYEGNSENMDKKLNTVHSIPEILKRAQTQFNKWESLDIKERTAEQLQKMLDYEFFEVLDSVTISRSRKHIQKYYDTSSIGKFPERLKPISIRPKLTDLEKAISYKEIAEQLIDLNMSIYTPSHYIHPSKIAKYEEIYGDNKISGFTQATREMGLKRLMTINLLKRMESSVNSFNLTLTRIREQIKNAIKTIEEETYNFGKKIKIDIADMDYISWKKALKSDLEILELLISMVGDITPEYDTKLKELRKIIRNKIQNPTNNNNKKIIIFTAFADTAKYIYENLSPILLKKYNLHSALITGSSEAKTTLTKIKKDLNTILTYFSPISKEKKLLDLDDDREIDILIATDCISEGQNLQDCDFLINYDIHWNPVRIIQRFGRIDRIGSKNKTIQLLNFWPDITLDEYINLKARVEAKMQIVNTTATGDENILSEEEKLDLEYRKEQLKRMQEEVVDIEEMNSGISIMDLGLNEFRLDLIDYIKKNPNIEKMPQGLHAITKAQKNQEQGIIFVLKNTSNTINKNDQNRLHPFYLVYINNQGEIIYDHLSPKKTLDALRYLCKGKDKPIPELYKQFNKETKDGRKMEKISKLLGETISSIINVKEESDIDSFLGGKTVDFTNTQIKGLDDFELISFIVVK